MAIVTGSFVSLSMFTEAPYIFPESSLGPGVELRSSWKGIEIAYGVFSVIEKSV